MSSAAAKATRPLRALLVTGLIAASVVALGSGTARASTSGLFVACGDANNTSTLTIGNGCTSLSTAISDAINFSSAVSFGTNATIEMMPGSYCPVTIPPDYDANLSLFGVGAAGLANPSYSGPEANLSSFDLGAAACGEQSAPDNELSAPGGNGQFVDGVSLENIGFDGTATDGPANGISAFDTTLSLHDVLVENFTATGLTDAEDTAYANAQDGTMNVINSAFINNHTGVYDKTGNGSRAGGGLMDTLLAGNQAGLVSAGYLNLNGNTIAHNVDGIVESDTSNNTGQSLNNIVADSSDADCVGTNGTTGGVFEPSGGFNGDNLVDSTCTGSTDASLPDQTPSSTIAAVALVSHAPTPSIVPPTEALGHAGDCGDNGSGTRTDQIEDLVTPADTCDIGSIQTTNVTTSPTLVGSDSAIGAVSVPDNQSFGYTTFIGNAGGGLMGTSSVSTSGDPVFSVSGDNCTDQVVLPSQNAQQCSVTVTGAPTSAGASSSGDLNVVTTAGSLSIALSMTSVGPFEPPTGVSAVANSGKATVSFTPPVSPTATITGYDVQASTDGGQTWSEVTSVGAASSHATINAQSGVAYEFEVASEDGYGDSPWSTPTAAVALLDTTALTPPTAATTKAGAAVTETTKLSDKTTTSYKEPGATVVLTANGSTTGVSATTNSQGVATVTVHPTANTTYTWRFAGDEFDHPATSTTAVVTVEQVVKASLSAKRVKHGKTVQIYGTVSPNEKGKTVVVQTLVRGKWKSLRHPAVIKVQKLPGRRQKVLGFVYTDRPAKKGKQTLRVIRAKTATNAAGVSATLALKVT